MLLAACSGERKDALWWDNEKQIIELRSDIDLARYKVDMLAPEQESAPSGLSVEKLNAELESLSAERARLSVSVAEMRDGWQDFRASVLARRRYAVVGKSFETFETAQGREYSEVTITGIDDSGVSLRHKAGSARLRFEDLNQSRREFFGLDGELASIAHEAEAEQAIAYNRWIDKRMEEIREEEAQQTAIRQKEEEKTRRARERALAANRRAATPSALTGSFGNLGDTRTISSGRRYSSYGSYRRTRYRYYYTNNTTPTCQNQWSSISSTYRPSVVTTVPQAVQTTPCPSNPFNP